MSKLITLFLLCITSTTTTVLAQTTNTVYNPKLADSMKADDYGMKMYVLAILKTGPNQSADEKTTDSLFQGHMANIGRLADAGKLIVAGPLKKNDKTYRGIFILAVNGIANAKELLQTDPAIKAQLLEAELYEWYGSAALPIYLPFHKQVTKKEF